jgi:hypothetical protein
MSFSFGLYLPVTGRHVAVLESDRGKCRPWRNRRDIHPERGPLKMIIFLAGAFAATYSTAFNYFDG